MAAMMEIKNTDFTLVAQWDNGPIFCPEFRTTKIRWGTIFSVKYSAKRIIQDTDSEPSTNQSEKKNAYWTKIIIIIMKWILIQKKPTWR